MKKRFLQPRPPQDAHPPDPDTTGPRPGFLRWRLPSDHERAYRSSHRSRQPRRIGRLLGAAMLLLSVVTLLAVDAWGERLALVGVFLIGTAALLLHARHSRRVYLQLDRLQEQAQVDGLTGALNRGAFHAHLARAWRQAERAHVAIGLVLLDVDHFKQLNDRLGHPVGDRVLQRAAGVLKSYAVRPLDAVGRYGGDEFILAWYDADPTAFAALVRLLPAKLWLGLASVHDHAANLTVSGGAVFVYPDTGNTIEDAIRLADEELYGMKRQSRGSIALAALPPRALAAQSARAIAS